MRQLGRRLVAPVLGAIPVAGAIAVLAFALQSTLNNPPPGSNVATAAVASIERLRAVRSDEWLPGHGLFAVTCSARNRVDRVFLDGRLFALVRGTRIVAPLFGSGVVPASVQAKVYLAGCPGFLSGELAKRLVIGERTFRRSAPADDGLPGYILRIRGPDPLIELTVSRRTFRPMRIHLEDEGLSGYSDVVRVTPIHAQTQAAAPRIGRGRFLFLAQTGLAKTVRAFWNPALHWYDERASKTWNPTQPLAHLWSAFPLFEALDGVAIADPTATNRNAVDAFARGASRYFNPDLRPVGGYSWYPGMTNPRQHTFFDDNGWWELAYLDAYRATHDPQDLVDAERAFRFIAVSGWDPASGGTWWETLHEHKTSEPLAAEIYSGFGLYLITGQSTYRRIAEKFLDWANAHSWNAQAMLYGRNRSDGTVLDYVEGMMIGAQLELCQIDKTHGPCAKAEELAQASTVAFPHDADWTPAADVMYMRFVLDLYRRDKNPEWYDLVYDNARRAMMLARSADGLYFKRWDGSTFPARLLQPDAATLSLFAWLGGVRAPT